MLDKILLFPYYLALKTRHALYNKGLKKVHRSEVPTVCVGNITVGGTGKTPHTEMILKLLLRSNEWGMKDIAVLSRGYKRSSKHFQQVTPESGAGFAGDEPAQIKKKFPGITVAVDADRIEGCRFLAHPEELATDKNGQFCVDKRFRAADLIVLDDAFQYRALKADFSVVLIDYNRPLHKDSLLPIGSLRDLPERLKEADAIIVTKCPAAMESWERVSFLEPLGIDFEPSTCFGRLKNGKEIPILFSVINYCPLEPVFPEHADNRYSYSPRAILITGIAKAAPLARYLSDRFKILRHFDFADHHSFSRADIHSIEAAIADNPTATVITTEKDAQRIIDCKYISDSLKERLFSIPVEASFLSQKEEVVFTEVMLEKLSRS